MEHQPIHHMLHRLCHRSTLSLSQQAQEHHYLVMQHPCIPQTTTTTPAMVVRAMVVRATVVRVMVVHTMAATATQAPNRTRSVSCVQMHTIESRLKTKQGSYHGYGYGHDYDDDYYGDPYYRDRYHDRYHDRHHDPLYHSSRHRHHYPHYGGGRSYYGSMAAYYAPKAYQITGDGGIKTLVSLLSLPG